MLSNFNLLPSDSNESKWLTAYQQKSLKINTFKDCICFSDLESNNDFHLLIGNLSENFKNPILLVFKGTSLKTQIKLVDFPISVIDFYLDQNDILKTPLIAVATSYCIFIYKNLKPFYKFSLPEINIDSTEYDAWNQFKNDKIDINVLKEILIKLKSKIGESSLTENSQILLKLNDENKINTFVEIKKKINLKRLNLITCMSKIKKSVLQDKKACYLIVGTENCDLFLVETNAFTIIFSTKLPSIPVFIEASGSYDIDFCIIINCRNNFIYTFKKEFKVPKLIIKLNSQCSGMIKSNNNLMITCLNKTLNCFSLKGNCFWTIEHNFTITAITFIYIEMFNLSLTAIALANKKIIFYNDQNIVDILIVDEIITSLKFGKFSREDNTLIMITEKGDIKIMFLKRTARLNNLNINKNQNMNELGTNTSLNKLSIPKKTKVFIDQTLRERENPIDIYKTFQQDLYRMKLISSRAYVKAINYCLNPVSINNQHPIKINAQIHGLGPIFNLVLEIQNISIDNPSTNLLVSFNSDKKIYKLFKNYIFIPFLTPGESYSFENKIQTISEFNISGQIKIYIFKKDEKYPLVTAIVNMPKSINLKLDF